MTVLRETVLEEECSFLCTIVSGQEIYCDFFCTVEYYDIKCELVFWGFDCNNQYETEIYYNCEEANANCHGIICTIPMMMPQEEYCSEHCEYCD